MIKRDKGIAGDRDDAENDVDLQAADWFAKLNGENVSNEDKAAFFRWLNQSTECRVAFNEISALWGNGDLLQALQMSARKHRIAPRQRKYVLPLALAACLALAFGFGNELVIRMQGDYSTGVGERKTLILEDGSTALLNTQTVVAVNMDGPQRKVELLKGEVYFEVQHDPARPFIVRAAHSTTRVLGTRFFVHELSDSDEVKVVSGRVEVFDRRRTAQPKILHDSETVSVDASGAGEIAPIVSPLTTSWVNGVLVFENMPLERVIGQICRYRRGLVLYRDDSLRHLKINGRINLRESGDMLKVLGRNLSIKMTYLTDWLVIVG